MMEPTTNEAADFALDVVRTLRHAGHEALWAGGCVRDLLLRLTPKDYDVATSARPEEVQRLFRRTIAIGACFGVVQVRSRSGVDVEVATFRSDATYSDGRHPDAVVYSTPEQDALRRDFTINGMFFDPVERQLRDYVGGQEDLKRGIVRAIGDPALRIAEDKLRMLRAVRFAARFNWTIDPATAEGIRKFAASLHVVSAERILTELRHMLTPPTRTAALTLLRDVGLLEQVLPELTSTFADESCWQMMLRAAGSIPTRVSLPLAFALLVTAEPQSRAPLRIDVMMRRLKSSNEERERADWLSFHRQHLQDAPLARPSTLKRLFAHSGSEELIDYREAIERATTGAAPDAEYCRRLCQSLTPEEIDPPPLLTGNDLIALGLRPGPRFKQLLEQVRDEQLDGHLTDRDDALSFVRKALAATPE